MNVNKLVLHIQSHVYPLFIIGNGITIRMDLAVFGRRIKNMTV